MEFAKLCDYLKPTTLAAIVVDLGDGPFDNPLIDKIEEAQKVAMDALVANVGEVTARNMIEELEGQS
jgi:predicted mannosyl-3-phosphoglycerate phosphatase (HAD superfamily)